MTKSASVTIASGGVDVDAAAPLDTAKTVTTRLLAQMRKTAVLDAVHRELLNRMNKRIANGIARDGDRPRPPVEYLEDSMKHARKHAARMGELCLSL